LAPTRRINFINRRAQRVYGMNEDDKFECLTLEIRAAAEAELFEALVRDGATPESAREACESIAGSLAIFRMMKDGGHDPFDEIGRVRVLLVELNTELSALTVAGDSMLQDAISLNESPPLNRLRPDRPIMAFELFRRKLPTIIKLLPQRPTKKGGHDSRLSFMLSSVCMAWWRATGRLPSATKSEDLQKTSPLYRFCCAHADQPALSIDMWARVLRNSPGPSSVRKLAAPQERKAEIDRIKPPAVLKELRGKSRKKSQKSP
jgi:hypothetical protein